MERTSEDQSTTFEDIDWSRVEPTPKRLTPERLVTGIGLVLLGALFMYDRAGNGVGVVETWDLASIEWVILIGSVCILGYVIVPLCIAHEQTRTALAGVLRQPATLAAAVYLGIFVAVAVFGPLVTGYQELRFEHAFHPPLGATISGEPKPIDCLGRETPLDFGTACHGSWEYPLGTNERGHPMGYLLVEGARVALYVMTFTLAFVVPLATVVGVVAGLRGGLVDSVLMSYVDMQLSLPAIIVYIIGYMYWNPSLLLLLVTFGLLSWGGIARLVRSEVLQRREDGYVLVARSLGCSWRYLAKRHIVPNITNTLLPAVFQLFALLIVVEAGVAFLGYHQVELYSWGSTISESINAAVPATMQGRTTHPAYQIWWVSTLPAIALTCTVLALKILGDRLRDALDPRGGW